MTRTLSLSLFKHVDCSDGDVIFAEHRELERALLLLEQRHALLVGTKKHPVHLLQSVSDLDASILLRGTQDEKKKKKRGLGYYAVIKMPVRESTHDPVSAKTPAQNQRSRSESESSSRTPSTFCDAANSTQNAEA